MLQTTRRNSSSPMSACLSTPRRVPWLTSECRGTTQPLSPRRRMAWLPRCRRKMNPSRSSALITSRPETQGNLGMGRLNRKSGQQCPPHIWSGKFFEVQLGGFLEIRQSLLHRLTLRCCPGLRVKGYQPSTIGIWINNGIKQFHKPTLAREATLSTIVFSSCRKSGVSGVGKIGQTPIAANSGASLSIC